MFPVKPFLYVCKCDIHREFTEHEIFFMDYDCSSRQVSFQAVCVLCSMESKDDKTSIGFTGNMHITDWNDITPEEDEPILS